MRSFNVIDSNLINNILVYTKLLEKVNIYLFKLYGIRTLQNDSFTEYNLVTDNFSDSLLRIVGYEWKKNSNKLITSRRNGILSVANISNIYDLYSDLDSILVKNADVINALKLYRNKSQHNNHMIGFSSIGGSNNDFDISFTYDKNDYLIHSEDLCKLVISLNKAFCNFLSKFRSMTGLDLETRINSAPIIDSYLQSGKFLKYNELLQEQGKKYISDLINRA